jgi:hypothetical protein
MECFIHQMGEEPLDQPLSGYVSCLRPVDPVELLLVHLQMLCVASRIDNFWDRVSMLLPFRYVSVGCKFSLLARSFCCRHDVAYHFVPSGSDGVWHHSTVAFACAEYCVLCVCTYLCYTQRGCLGILCYLDPKRERTRDCSPLHSELVLFKCYYWKWDGLGMWPA